MTLGNLLLRICSFFVEKGIKQHFLFVLFFMALFFVHSQIVSVAWLSRLLQSRWHHEYHDLFNPTSLLGVDLSAMVRKEYCFLLFLSSWNDTVYGWWRFICRARWSDREKHRPHTIHLNGFAPVCFRMWRVSSSDLANLQSHPGQLQL